MADDMTNSDLFRQIMTTDGPIVTDSSETFRDAVAALAARLDGAPTGATIRVAKEDDRRWAWFASGEADIVWRSGGHDLDIDDVIDDMPYQQESVGVSIMMDVALGWPEAGYA